MNDRPVPAWLKATAATFWILANLAVLFTVFVHTDILREAVFADPDAILRWTREVYGAIEITGLLLLVLVTIVMISMRITYKFPSKITVGTMVYHDVMALAAVLILYLCDSSNMYFPYQVLGIIPALTAVLSTFFLLYDYHHMHPNTLAGTNTYHVVHSKKTAKENRDEDRTFTAETYNEAPPSDGSSSDFSAYIDDETSRKRGSRKKAPTSKKTEKSPRSRRKPVRPADRSKPAKEPAPAAPKTVTKPDHSNDTGDLFKDTDPAFLQAGNPLDAMRRGEPGSSVSKTAAAHAAKDDHRELYAEFSSSKGAEVETDRFAKKAPDNGKLSSTDAEEALKTHSDTHLS